MAKTDAEIDAYSATDIRNQIARILRDLGNPEPPLNLDDVMELLKLDLDYYSRTDLTLFDEIAHKIKVAGKQIIRRPGRILDVIRKARLSALWLPDGRQILIDDEVPEPKHRHLKAHEITHSVTPWHKIYLLGDNEITLDPGCEAVIEAEANYGGGQLLFLMDRFSREARDLDLSWDSIQKLKKRYGNTMTTTLWHTIEERKPDHPVVGLISRHPRRPSIGSGADGKDFRHFIPSRRFRSQFSNIRPEEIYSIVEGYVDFRRKGPVGQTTISLTDVNGMAHEFYFERFSNGYDLLTFGMALRVMPTFAKSKRTDQIFC